MPCALCLRCAVRRMLIGLLAIMLTCRAAAQDGSTAALRGMVVDPAGRSVVGALVVIVEPTTSRRYHMVTDGEGRYSFQLLPAGDYLARVEAPGMSPQSSPQFHLDVGGERELNFGMAIAGAKESITVSGAPPEVETQSGAVSAVVEERTVGGLPLNGRRFTDLALLTPGVTQDPRGLTSASNGDLAFGGIRGYHSSYLVDGTDNNNGFFAQARGRYRAPYQFSNEVVQEFRVSSNTYGAELGRSGGAVVNVVTKSGSNHWHGTGFYFIRDSALNAEPAATGFKPSDRQHQFGFTLGGPVKRNRAFFFAGYDQHIFDVPTVVRFVNGEAAVVPQKGAEPLQHGDYEESDKELVFATAAQLSKMAGSFHSRLLGNTLFGKLDVTVGPRNYLSARLNTSRYWGVNNVYFDPASPITTYAISSNGEEDVATESATASLTSGLRGGLTSHLRAQFSRDLQKSYSNSTSALTRIYGVTDGFGRSSILPRETLERRLHFVETMSLERGRHSWKFGGDLLFTRIRNYFPSLFGGEYIFDDIKVNPWTFEPMRGEMETTPLRAFAHRVPRYYVQNFGTAVSHPDSNDYSAFIQDTMRVTNRLALSLGARYDLQTLSEKELASNPLWPGSGKLPRDINNLAPRVGLAYSIGEAHPLVLRAGYGTFYTRIPQIYTSTVITDNGLASTHLALDNTDYYEHQVFPTYPVPLVTCALKSTYCALPATGVGLQTDISAFAANFRTPKVEQASGTAEKEIANRLAAGISYMYVHGVGLIRARDVNLPEPTTVSYPLYDDVGATFLGSYYDVPSFSNWASSPSIACPFLPCINPLARPIPQLGAINQFESAASSVYHGFTLSLRRRMTHGLYYRLAYTYAHATDDGQDALVAGRPGNVQNSYSTASERGPSVTDQRQRLAFSWIAEPRPFGRGQEWAGRIFNDWKLSGVFTYGSGRPVNARVYGDPNQDGNSSNDRLPGQGRNSFLGPDYATTDMRLTRQIRLSERLRIDLMAESFNLFNRANKRVQNTDDGYVNTAGTFVRMEKTLGNTRYPGHYRHSSNFLQSMEAYSPRQMQLALKLVF